MPDPIADEVADEVIKGLDEFTEQPLKRSIRIGEPIVTTRTFIGPQAKSDTFAAKLLKDYKVLTMDQQKGTPSIIEITTDETLDETDPDLRVLAEVTWSLDWEREMKDLSTHGWFDVAAGSGTGGQSAKYVMEQIDIAMRSKSGAAGVDWNTKYGNIVNMNDYRDCRLLGINHWISYAPNLKCTLKMGRYTILDVEAVPVSQIIAWTDVKLPFSAASAQTPSAGGINQPTVHSYFGEHPPTGGTGNVWQNFPVNQWLVSPVRRNFNKSRGIYEMTFEWLGATEWTSFLYDGGSGGL